MVELRPLTLVRAPTPAGTEVKLIGLAAALVLSACGASSGPGARFSGSSEAPIAAPWQLTEDAVVPEGYAVIGNVTASCNLSEGRRTIERERLIDVDCSEARLMRALRERAAAAGGQLLVARDCASQVVRESTTGRTLHVRCSAEVARAETSALGSGKAPPGTGPGPTPEQAALVDEPHAGDAWRICIDFTPAPETSGTRPARRGDLVREVANFPVSHVRLGDLVARCYEGCAEQSVRASVRIAAGRVGATDVVDVRCVEQGRGVLCTGTAAAYEVDPGTDPALQ